MVPDIASPLQGVCPIEEQIHNSHLKKATANLTQSGVADWHMITYV